MLRPSARFVRLGLLFRLKAGQLPTRRPRRTLVVVAEHPAQARVVSAEVGERRRAGNGIRHVIVAALGMRDGVPANRAGATCAATIKMREQRQSG